MKIDATIQARFGSSRLPGKVLMEISGKPLLEIQIERLRRSRHIDRIIIATTNNPANDRIEVLADRLGCGCFRGSEDDVLGRISGALAAFEVEGHAEFQGDNPLPDPEIVDFVIGYFLEHPEFDYVTNALKTTYPPGQEVSVYRASTLADAEKQAADTPLREHVGLHIYHYPERYRLHNIEAPDKFCRPDFHLEVDTEEDFRLVEAVYTHFMPQHPGFSLGDMIAFLNANPDLAGQNAAVPRRWEKFRK